MAKKTIERMSNGPTGAGTRQAGHRPAGAPGAPAPAGQQRDVFAWLDVARYAGPLITGLMIYPVLAIVVRDLTASSLATRVIVSVALLASAYGFPLLAWLESAPRQNTFDRARASISIVWLFLAALGTAWFGGPHKYLVDAPWSWFLFGAGFLLALWWIIGALPAVAGRGEDHHPQADTLAEALGLGQSRIIGAEHDPNGTRSMYRFKLKGVSVQALRDAIPLLTTRLQVPGNGVRVVTNLDNDAEPTMVVVREDVLRKLGPWPGPSRPGGSITEPCRVGRREDNSLIEVIKHGSQGGRHKLVAGMNGSGKTEGELNELAEITTRIDVICIWVDAIKAGQTVPDFAPALAKVATTKSQAVQLTQALVKAVEYRANTCKTRVWVPSPTHPAVAVNYEEGALLAEVLGSDLLDFVSTARSVGFFITFSLQRPSGPILSTDIRAQFPDRQCYGVDNADTADMVLPDKLTENGALPERWGQDYPGYHYRTAGTDFEQAMPSRSWKIPPIVMRRHVAEFGPKMCAGRGPVALDAGTAAAMGPAWTELTSGPEYALAHGWSQDETGAWVVPVGPEDETGTGTVPGPRETGDNVRDARIGTVIQVYGTGSKIDSVIVSETTQDRPGTGSETTQDRPGTGTGETETGRDRPGTEDDIDEDGLTVSERVEIAQEIATVRDEIAAELGEIDEDLAQALAEAEGQKIDDADLPNIKLWNTASSGLSYSERVQLVASKLAAALAEAGGPIEIKVGALAESLAEADGWQITQARPALYRLLHKAEEAGYAENLLKGGRWLIDPHMPAWLIRETGNLEATEGEDDE
jgi:hypothetical protein